MSRNIIMVFCCRILFKNIWTFLIEYTATPHLASCIMTNYLNIVEELSLKVQCHF